jgi:hypothetical protein
MVSCGDGKDTVSRAIGCSIPTLELHFEEELKDGWAKTGVTADRETGSRNHRQQRRALVGGGVGTARRRSDIFPALLANCEGQRAAE